MSTDRRQIDAKTVAAMQACVDHARALLESARVVRQANHANIGYHLATLTLEELGRRELIAVQSLSEKQLSPPAWPGKHTQDHVKKLFWCFFGGAFASRQLTGKELDEMNGLATTIHANRLAGLYVDHGEDDLGVPHQAITPQECDTLIELAAARLEIVENEKLRDYIPPEEVELQNWFLKIMDDPEKRKMIFSGASMKKLAELKDARAWGLWIKTEFDKADAETHAIVEAELKRSRELPATGTKNKWKLRIRIISASHSIRQKELMKWNKTVDWIKLVYAKKDELIFELILKDNVPVEALWYFGWGIARHFVVALNIGTMGFWWWRMPERISRYYESLEDLERNAQVGLERSPSLKVDWGGNRVLTDEDLGRVALCMSTLPGPNDRDKHVAYNHYIGGLTFLSLNDVHWQCESTVYGNFHLCLKAMMEEAGDLRPGDRFQDAFLHFLDTMFPAMDERAKFADLCDKYESASVDRAAVTLKEAAFIKAFCDAYFLRQAQRRHRVEAVDGDDPPAQAGHGPGPPVD